MLLSCYVAQAAQIAHEKMREMRDHLLSSVDAATSEKVAQVMCKVTRAKLARTPVQSSVYSPVLFPVIIYSVS